MLIGVEVGRGTISDNTQKILLVGGLGGSRYIYSMLQLQFENVLQPRRASVLSFRIRPDMHMLTHSIAGRPSPEAL
jgi:hypothetical protein